VDPYSTILKILKQAEDKEFYKNCRFVKKNIIFVTGR
jgi:hypothetical protein